VGGRPLTRRRLAAGLAVGVAMALAGCGHDPADDPPALPEQVASLASFEEGGVRVEVVLRQTSRAARLQVRLAPVEQGFHVYSIDLPDDGVDGLGTPTRVSVSGGLTSAGRLTAQPEPVTLELPELGVTLPVYPDGPAVLDLPVRVSGPVGEVRLTYGACSKGMCLPPVRDRLVTVDLPPRPTE
jgi:hypothetical protein